MRPRNSEAERLEIDYLFRLNAALEGHDPASRAEIVESLREHIEEALGEGGSGTVGLAEMAAVLERLGPPEDVAHSEDASGETAAHAENAPPEAEWRQQQAHPMPAGRLHNPQGHVDDEALTGESAAAAVAVLGKIWWAFLVMAIGLYIPFINFQFCEFIGLIIFIIAAFTYQGPHRRQLQTAAVWALVTVALQVIYVPAAILNLRTVMAGLLTAPIAIAMLVCLIVTYWLALEMAAKVMDQLPRPDVAGRIRAARVLYLVLTVVFVVVATIVSVIAAKATYTKNPAVEWWWLGYAVLPLGWLISWLFWLRPITLARRALLEAQGGQGLTAA